jgi:hypothetical protein
MKGSHKVAVILAGFAIWSTALLANTDESKAVHKADPSPFAVSIVPSWSGSSGRGISMATNTLDTFYVILTNVSKRGQAVFNPSNSWGYYAVSFRLRTSDGHIVAIRKKQTGFTRNLLSTFLIPPGEQVVYPIKLDEQWEAEPQAPIANMAPINIRVMAIYEIASTPESMQKSVWTGRVESAEYQFQFRHWR